MGQVIAAFDFDGTLSRRDAFVPFLWAATSKSTVARAALTESRSLLGVALKRADRDELKARVVSRVLTGLDRETLEAAGRSHAERVAREWMRPEMLARVASHRAEGHHVAIVSASLDTYLHRIAEIIGIDTVLCTTLEYGPDGRTTGRLVGGNCRGPEKLRRLRAHFGADGYELHAYGDSSGDADLLAAADVPVWVGTRAKRS